MPVIVQTVSSKVTALWGRTYIRGADGKFKLLQLGDDVARGDVLLTEQNAIAELSLGPVTEAPPVTSKAKAAAPDTSDMDRAIAGLERGDADAATAAGLAASDGVLTEASWVQRIKEEVTPLSSSTAGLPSGPIVGDPAGAPRIMTATVGEPYSAKMGGSPGVKAAGINDAVETEGGALVFTVTLDATTNTAAVLPFDMSHTSSSDGDVGAPLFSNGVVVNADGTLTVPAGVSSFVVTVPIVDDATVEGDERLTVTVGTSTAAGTLLDNDSVRITQIEPLTPGADGGTSDTVIEGGSLVFGVQLSAAASAPKTFPFALGNGTTGPEELGAPVFSNGVTLNADGTITVPAGVDSFTVTVPTVQDTAVEPTESAPLSIGGVSVTGYVQDDDAPVIDRIEPKVPGPDGATSDTVTEGGELVFAVQLSAPTSAPTNFPFTLGGGSAAADELGSPVFSNGVTLNADGTITVPAGVGSFTVTVPTVQDTAVETTESAPLSIGGVSVTGYVRDDDAPIIDRIEPKVPGPDGGTGDTVTEGGELVFAVKLSAPTNAPTNFPFTLGGGSAAADELGSPVFSNGVTLNADGTITVPAGVDSFSVTVPTVQDTAVESTESAPLTIGGVSVTGFVADDDVPVIDRIEPKIPNPDGGTSDTVTEGGELVFAVQLSAPTNAPTKFPFTLGGGSAAADELGSPVFSNGVTLNDDGTITIPAGVDSFTVTVPTVQDTAVESTESAPLTIGGVSVTGYVQDDDAPVIDRIEPKVPGPDGGTSDTVTEGSELVFAVQLSAPTNAPTNFPFTLGGGSAAADELGSPVFSNGVTLNADGTITVPAGVDSFTVTVPTVQDTAVETTESAPLSIGGVSVTGYVQDDDAPVIDRIEPKVPGPDGGTTDTVTEGGELVFAVQLSAPTNAPTNFPFTLGGGSAAADELGTPVFSNGVTLNADGTITVPAGVDSFTVTVPTVQDTAVEPTESAPLTIGGVSVTGFVQDDDAPVIDRIEPKVPGPDGGTTDTVTEGGELVFAVQLSAPTSAPTNFPFTLGGGSAAADELGSPVFSNGVTLNDDGTITVPAGVDSFTVTVPTVQDTAVETTESAPLSIGGVSVTGYVQDDDAPVIDRIEPKVPGPDGGTSDTVTEGGELVFAVQLSAPTNAPTSFPFTLGGGSAAADELGSPVFSNGVTLNDDGTITVPAGVDSFTVTVPTVQDTAVEPTESAPLTIGGVSVTGFVQDDDAPVIDRIEPKVPGPDGGTTDTVTEGGELVFAVQLSAPTNAPTNFPFTLGGGSAAADELGAPVFSNGVTLNDDGTITVPAGVDSFTVTVPTVQDTAVETTESAPLSIGGVSVTGYVADDDVPVIDRIEPKVPNPNGGTSDTVTEGGDLVFAVQLSAPTNAPTNFPFTLGGGSAAADELGSPVFSNGVTLNDDGTITVPAGVDSFTVTVPTVQDTAVESTESAPLTIGGVSVTGYVADDDVPVIDRIEPKVPNPNGGTSDTVTEGGDLVFAVQLSAATNAPTNFPFTLGGGSAAADELGSPVFSNGVTLNADGTITVPAGVDSFTVTVPTVQDTAVEPTESAPLTIGGVSVTGYIADDDRNSAPKVTSTGASVSEESLAGGIKDDPGQPLDLRDRSTTTGRVVITDAEGDAVTDVVLVAPTTPLTSAGQAVVWTGTGTSVLTASAGGATVATAQIDANGNYSFTLLKPIEHADGQGENVQQLDIGVQASDGKAIGSGTISITVEDDTPAAADLISVINAPMVNTNVMVVLDVSGSMGDPSGIPGQTRLQAAVSSLQTVLDRYDDMGDVAVRLVTFSSEGKALGDSWTTVAEAKTLLANLQSCGSTNYDDALADAIKAFDAPGRIPDGQNVAYFLSDGEPTVGSGNASTLAGALNNGTATTTTTTATTTTGGCNFFSGGLHSLFNGGFCGTTCNTTKTTTEIDKGIQPAEEKIWTDFLSANGIDARAVGMGTTQATLEQLNPIAYDGVTQTNTGATAVAHFADLTAALAPSAGAVANGNLFSAGLGADGGHVHSFTVEGIAYTYNPDANGGRGDVAASAPGGSYRFDAATQSLTVDTASGGRFTVDLDDGTYQYRAPANASAGTNQNFGYALIDNDGDISQATGIIKLERDNQAPVAVADVASIDTATTNFVHNAGFEQYSGGTDYGTFVAGGKLANWTVEIENGGGAAELHKDAAEGRFALDMEQTSKTGATRNLSITQDIEGLTAGQSYQLQFDAERGTGQANASAKLDVYFGGKLVATLDPGTGYQTHSFTVTAGANPADNQLKFVERGAANTDGQTNNTGTYLDNVRLTSQVGQRSGNVLTNDTDADAGDTLTVTAVASGTGTAQALPGTAIHGTYGTLMLQADGSYTYVADQAATKALTIGQTGQDVFSYTISDAAGATSSTTLTLNVAGNGTVQLSNQVSGTEDQCITLKWEHFGSGPALNSGQSVSFTKLPADGELELCVNGCWRDVCAGEQISKTSIDCGQLRFKPDANEAGADALGRDGVGNGKNTYAVMDYAVHLSNGQMAAHGSLDVDIKPVADCPPTLTCNLMSAHGAAIGAPAGHHDGETVLSNGTVVAAGTPGGYFGLWHHVCLQSCSVSPDKDGSEQAFYQLKVNQLDVATSPTVVALNDGTVLAPAADGSYWLAADQADKVWLFRQWGAGPSGNQYSHQSVTATSWNAELDANGTIIHKVQGNSITSCSNTPLVLDLDGNGIQTVDSKAGASFDYDGDGVREATGWVGGKDGLLVRDADGDGHITAGRELFGDAVQLADGSRAVDGYSALRELDSNKDGVISSADRDFAQLKVWVDGNGDGSTQDGELLSLKDAGVASLNLQAQATDHVDNGNHIALTSDFTRTDGSVHAMADVWFGAQTPHEPAQDATSDIVPLPVNAWDQQVFAWELATPAAEPQETLQITELSTDAGLDLRDLLGGATLTGAADPLAQLLEATAPLPAQKEAGSEGKAETAAHAPSSSTEEAHPALDVFQLNSNGAENFVMQELMDRNKLDHGF